MRAAVPITFPCGSAKFRRVTTPETGSACRGVPVVFARTKFSYAFMEADVSDVIEAAVAALNEKLSGGFDSVAKFVLEGEGAIVVDGDGARAGDDDAEVTLSASTETFQAIIAGEMNPTAAFMSGKLAVDGDMGAAMRLGGLLG